MTKLYDFLLVIGSVLMILIILALMPPYAEAAYTFDGNDVGDLDTLLDVRATGGKTNPATETAYLQELLGPDVTFISKTETVFASQSVEDPNVLVFALDPPDDLYILKNAKYWAAFGNIALLEWAVFDSTLLPSDMNLSAAQLEISHVSVFNGGDVPPPPPPPPPQPKEVPVPAPLALLGLGLVGLAAVRRK